MDKMPQLFYDAESDVLYLSIAQPRPAITQELVDDVLLRVDPETSEIIGLTVLNLSSRFGSVHLPQSLPIEMDLRKLA